MRRIINILRPHTLNYESRPLFAYAVMAGVKIIIQFVSRWLMVDDRVVIGDS